MISLGLILEMLKIHRVYLVILHVYLSDKMSGETSFVSLLGFVIR